MMKFLGLVVALLLNVGSSTNTELKTCPQQDKCLTFTESTTDCSLDGDDCKFVVCLEFDTSKPGCRKGGKAVDHICYSDEDKCAAGTSLPETKDGYRRRLTGDKDEDDNDEDDNDEDDKDEDDNDEDDKDEDDKDEDDKDEDDKDKKEYFKQCKVLGPGESFFFVIDDESYCTNTHIGNVYTSSDSPYGGKVTCRNKHNGEDYLESLGFGRNEEICENKLKYFDNYKQCLWSYKAPSDCPFKCPSGTVLKKIDFESGVILSNAGSTSSEVVGVAETPFYSFDIDGAGAGGFGAVLFDSDCSGAGCSGEDPDLGVMNGKILIISEDGNGSDPDDDFGGGTICVNFNQEIAVSDLSFIDVDSNANGVTKAEVFSGADCTGSVMASADASVLPQINGVGQVEVVSLAATGRSLKVTLSSSGAVDDFNVCVPEECPFTVEDNECDDENPIFVPSDCTCTNLPQDECIEEFDCVPCMCPNGDILGMTTRRALRFGAPGMEPCEGECLQCCPPV